MTHSLTETFPRVRIAHVPTPLERLHRLEGVLESPVPIFIKRDDCTGLATGGNKIRQLEFYFGEAREKGVTHVFITGAVQSNFVRSATAFAAKLGMKCTVQLEDRVADKDDLYHHGGNVLLDRMFGAEVVRFHVGEDEDGADKNLEAMAEEVRSKGEVPYVIHLSESPRPLGALGYVCAAEELLKDFDMRPFDLAHVILPSGSASTHAGMLTGLCAYGRSDISVLGVCVRRAASLQGPRVRRVCQALETMMGIESVVEDGLVQVTDVTFEGGYGLMGDSTREAMEMGARLEGLVLDPVYTAKGFAALIDFVRNGEPRGPIVFVHTGGLPAVFAYGQSILR